MKTKHYFMADGMRAGIGLEGIRAGVELHADNVSLTKSEADSVKRVMKRRRAKYNAENNEWVLNKPSKYKDVEDRSVSTLRIALREHETNAGVFFFNISGNPLKHFTGSNVYGSPQAGILVRKTFLACLKWLDKEMEIEQSVYDKVQEGKINLHNMEFAIYTEKCDVDVKPMINIWRYVYRAADWAGADGVHKSLDQLIGVNSRRQVEEYEDSFAVEVMRTSVRSASADGRPPKLKRETVSGICIYDKSAELLNTDSEVSAEILEDLAGRMRIDLWLTRLWLSDKRIQTVLDLESYVEKQHNGDWKQFIVIELENVINKTALHYMFKIYNIFKDGEVEKIPTDWSEGSIGDRKLTDAVKKWADRRGIDPRIPYEAHAAIVWALKLKINGADKVAALRNDQAMQQIIMRASSTLERVSHKWRERASLLLNFDTSIVDIE